MPARRRRDDDDDGSEELDELERAELAIESSTRRKSKGKSKGKERRRRSNESEQEEEEEEDDDGMDGDASHAAGRKGKLSSADLESKAHDLVRYAICNEISHKLLQRADINKKVLAGASRSFAQVFEAANKMLRNDFGMELVEIVPRPPAEDPFAKAKVTAQSKKRTDNQDNADASSGSEDEGGKKKKKPKKGGDTTTSKKLPAKQFCLRTCLPDVVIQASAVSNDGEDVDDAMTARRNKDVEVALGKAAPDELKDWKRSDDAILDWQTGPDQRTLMGILYVVLALILVNERVLTDDRLVTHLKKLDLALDTPLPVTVGALRAEKLTVNTFLSTLIKQGYLEKSKLAASGDQTKGGKGGATQTQRVRATQATQRQTQVERDDGQGAGEADEEWRWGPRSDVEVGEQGIAEFIATFFHDHARERGANNRSQAALMKDIEKGASGGISDKGGLKAARRAAL